MKKILQLGTFLFLVSVYSCQKEDNDAQPQVTAISDENSSPMQRAGLVISKDCAGCHAGGGGIIQFTSTEEIMQALGNGSISHRLFESANHGSCANIDEQSLKILKAWYQSGSPLQ